MTLPKSDAESARRAADTLLQGKIAVLPTDTIYGFSALAILDGKKSNLDKCIDKIKKSADSKPLIELIAAPNDLFRYTDQKIPADLLKKWPGALTLLVRNNACYSALTGREATAFRCPGDEWLRSVISLCASPIYSTSVNFSGSEPLRSDADILREFGGSISLFVTDAPKPAGLPSTLVSLLDGPAKIIRQGAVKLS